MEAPASRKPDLNGDEMIMSEKLALTEDILMKIEKPERYIGNEVNSVVKDKSRVKLRFAMCFPEIGRASCRERV